jgi:UDP-glucose 4-epimerase
LDKNSILGKKIGTMKKILITGGGGFIGSHLASRLISEGFAVVLVDNMLTGRNENLEPKAEYIEADISNPKDVQKIPHSEVSTVFHLAAQSSGEISFENPHADLQTNIGGTLLMLQWCKKHSIKRFIYTSSMAVYGTFSSVSLKEDAPCNPTSFYGVAKLASEHYIRLYASLGIASTIVRPFNVYGSRQNLDNMKQGMASIYLAYVLKGEPIIVKGSLDRFRDQTHVADVVDAMMLCLEKPIAIGKTYNIATGEKTTVRELIHTILKISGKSVNEYPLKVIGGTPGDIFGCYADIAKANTELGWKCRHTLESGLKEMYTYYVQKASHA